MLNSNEDSDDSAEFSEPTAPSKLIIVGGKYVRKYGKSDAARKRLITKIIKHCQKCCKTCLASRSSSQFILPDIPSVLAIKKVNQAKKEEKRREKKQDFMSTRLAREKGFEVHIGDEEALSDQLFSLTIPALDKLIEVQVFSPVYSFWDMSVAKKNSPNKFKSPPKKSPIKKIKKSSRNWSEEERFVLRTFINKYNKELQQVQKSTADARISAESSLLYVNLTV
ncbi:hypothetical protein OUZ56_005686 [Daphnia magna]|uniref:Uncharacterized protein n=1 Tax=Daphnia magna TaxID=35525 RepID=A0ABQ9YUV1_9CRUS|nr:hypothetical protein OUZ56_005686 [Daphnia magna]